MKMKGLVQHPNSDTFTCSILFENVTYITLQMHDDYIFVITVFNINIAPTANKGYDFCNILFF